MGNVTSMPKRKHSPEDLPRVKSVRGESFLQDDEDAWNELNPIIHVMRWVEDELTAYRSDPDRDEGPDDAVLGYIVSMATSQLEQTVDFGHQAYFKRQKEG